jgi:hypothetical protein
LITCVKPDLSCLVSQFFKRLEMRMQIATVLRKHQGVKQGKAIEEGFTFFLWMHQEEPSNLHFLRGKQQQRTPWIGSHVEHQNDLILVF